MTKPRLVKVRALFYVFQQIIKKEAAPILTQPLNKMLGGERGIRTPGGVTLNGFQDRRNRPLCHLSLMFLYSLN